MGVLSVSPVLLFVVLRLRLGLGRVHLIQFEVERDDGGDAGDVVVVEALLVEEFFEVDSDVSSTGGALLVEQGGDALVQQLLVTWCPPSR